MNRQLSRCTPGGNRRANRGRWKAAITSLVAVVLLALARWHLCHASHLVPGSHIPFNKWTTFKWESIQTSKALEWHSCYDDTLDCARLDVPMDWLSPSGSSRVVLAIARLRANISHKDPDYRGAVIFNPGGPGGSGIWALKDHGALLQTIVGANHDIVTFDPRGIGASVPRIDCWGGDEVRRALWSLQETPVVDAHKGALYEAFVQATAASGLCEQEMQGEDSLLAHVSTAAHARDMLEILDQMDQKGLKYWGFSYGTILGGTFAAMYPGRVERLVSDGNVDYREWHLGTHINFLRDTDKVMDAFYHFCHEAGKERCDMYAETPLKIKENVDRLIEEIKTNPILVPTYKEDGDAPEMPFVVTYSRLKRAISSVLYRPIHTFEPFARVLSALEAGNGWPFWDFFGRDGILPSSLCPADAITSHKLSEILAEDTDDAFPAIMCADGEQLTASIEELGRYAAELQELSTAAGAVNVLFRIACAGRTIRPKFRFAGPFEGNTSFPILYISNIADNVTPLVSARNNSAGFPGSVVLIQNSYGHTTLAAPSTCTASYIRAYFQNGTVPPAGTECEPDYAPFGVTVPGAMEHAELSQTMWELYKLPPLSKPLAGFR
ncbi:Alpha/Beta hydrolase protein [Mariannaea sp. PMI_226]|nr:Alpha/Beta hydrolase protein [Mariannaea sp. PMI_226]